ncbi:MAG: hypothetical protein K2R98_04260 [Gemmataceae bacterium]|nr:hypothetical protein [Gemmataceae bacterium]
MRRPIRSVALVLPCLALLATAPAVHACAYGAVSPLNRFAMADYVILGKVAAVDKQHVQVSLTKGDARQEFALATIAIAESLKGAKGLTRVRVAFQADNFPQVGSEGCFFVNRHHEQPFCFLAGGYDFPIYKQDNTAFERQMAPHRQFARLWDDPSAGLQSKDEEVRLITAGLLLVHHRAAARWTDAKDQKLEAIDAEQSESILKVLTEADWTARGPYRLSARGLFQLLQLTEKEGWAARDFKNVKEFDAAARRWLSAHASKYRIAGIVRG